MDVINCYQLCSTLCIPGGSRARIIEYDIIRPNPRDCLTSQIHIRNHVVTSKYYVIRGCPWRQWRKERSMFVFIWFTISEYKWHVMKKIVYDLPLFVILYCTWRDPSMIFTRDFVAPENHLRTAPLVTAKSLFTVSHILFYISLTDWWIKRQTCELVIRCSKLLFRYGSANLRICEDKYYEKVTLSPKYIRMARFPNIRSPDMRGLTVPVCFSPVRTVFFGLILLMKNMQEWTISSRLSIHIQRSWQINIDYKVSTKIRGYISILIETPDAISCFEANFHSVVHANPPLY